MKSSKGNERSLPGFETDIVREAPTMGLRPPRCRGVKGEPVGRRSSLTRTILGAFVVALGVVFVSPAYAVGECEDLSTDYTVTAVTKDGAFVVVTAEREWCAAQDEMEEVGGDAGELPSGVTTLVLDRKGSVLRRFDTPEHRYGSIAGLTLGSGAKSESLAALKAWRAKHPTVEASTLEVTLAAGCQQTVKTKALAETAGEFPKAKVTAAVKRGRATVWKKRLGTVDVDGDALAKFALYRVPGSSQMLLWTQTGTCHGPPPGHFGPDDGGECYQQWTPSLSRFKAPKKLQKCVAKAP